MKLLVKYHTHRQGGFALPTVMFLIVIMSFVAYAALLQSNNNLNLVYKQNYLQMARVASKAAIDYAQEEFDSSTCGTYNGTSEQDLVSTDTYRVTFKADVLSTSSDGYEKTVRGTGSIYLPKTSATAKYVFDIRSEIIRTYALCKTPDNFSPLLWLDASDTSTLFTQGQTSTTTVSVATDFGSANASTRDTVEERVDNGTQTTGSWQSTDLEMHSCDSTEFSSTICSSNNTRYLYSGIVFQNVNVPQGATITEAILAYDCAAGGTSGPLNHRIYGIYKSASDPHPDLFTSSGTNQVRTKINTSGLHTTNFENVSTNNCPPGQGKSMDVTDIVQEIINHSNWDPETGDGRMGFGIYRTAYNGSRRFSKDNIRLNITYTSNSSAQPSTSNGDSIAEWHDRSTNQYHAIATHGNLPTRVDNQINGKTILRFSNGNMLSTLTNALNNKREMTVLAVVKPSFDTSSSDGRFVTGMSSSQTSDTTSQTSIVPLLRYGAMSGFSSLYGGSSTSYRTNYTCGSSCANTPFIISSVFRTDGNNIDSALKGNGTTGATKDITPPTVSSPPYTYGINQIYIGGRRSGTMPGSGADYFNGDYGEIIVYDYALSCRYIEALEEYLRDKWNIYNNPTETTCEANTIPVL